MKPSDFTEERFQLKLPLYLDKETAFTLVATSSGLVSWFLGQVEFTAADGQPVPNGGMLHPGDRYRWTWEKGHIVEGSVIAYHHPDSFAFTFGRDFEVRFNVGELPGSDAERATELTLTQFNHAPGPDNAFSFINCCVCWTFFLSNLKSVAENGIDLRERSLIDESFINQ